MKSFILRACLAALLSTVAQAVSAQNIISILAAVTDLSCHSANGNPDGSIDVQVEGGTVPYTYEWTGPGGFFSTTEDQVGLVAGTYNLTVTDADGQTQSAEYTLSAPSQLVISESLNNPDCNGVNGSLTGTIDITPSGGVPPYVYEWTGPALDATSEDQWGLSSGTFCVTLTDALGCEATKCFDLTEPEPLQISADIRHSSCSASNGTSDGQINIVVTGGVAPYSYNWMSLGHPVDYNSQNQSGLSVGVYTVEVTDANGCTISENYIVTEPAILTIEEFIQEPACNSANGDYNGA